MLELVKRISLTLSVLLITFAGIGCASENSVESESVGGGSDSTTSIYAESNEHIDETTLEIFTSSEEDSSTEVISDETTTEETSEAITDIEEISDESTFEEETPEETTTENITTKETTSQKATTEKKTTEKKTTKKQETTRRQEITTEEETTTSIEDIPDGVVWKYESNIYADDPVKSEIEKKFWNNYHWAGPDGVVQNGWTRFSKKKSDEMTVAMVELVYDITQNYQTEFEREKALFDSICQACNYDYEDYNNGTYGEVEGSPYGVLVERLAVCGGYAKTFYVACQMMGIECKYVSGWAKYSGGRHAWNQVCIDGDWYEVDCTWSDANEGWSYEYFNITTEEMSRDHGTTNHFQCTGTKYNQKYIENMYKEEFLADKVYIESVDECMNYIVGQVENGNDDMMIYVPSEIIDAISDVISDYAVWDAKYPLSDMVKEKYFNYEHTLLEGYHYYEKGNTECVELPSISKIHICFVLDEYRLMENLVESQEEAEAYINKQIENGATEIIMYYPSDAGLGFTLPEPPDGMQWITVEDDNLFDIKVEDYSPFKDVYYEWIYYIKLQCVVLE